MDKRLNVAAKIVAYTTLVFFIAVGLFFSLSAVKPFWLDEWFIIHNIKFRSTQDLWGRLDFMQQFPRLYLQLVRQFVLMFDFSYTSLRLPSFIIHVAGVLLSFKLARKIYRQNIMAALLWCLLYVSFTTSIHYYVQVKQYTMEMLAALIAIWQLKTMLDMQSKRLPVVQLALLYVSMALTTFFSYTYPVIALTLFVVVIYRIMTMHKAMPRYVIVNSLVLLMVNAIAITVFYLTDVKQVLADAGMQNYWQDSLMQQSFSAGSFFGNIYKLFAHVGSGGLFEVVFAILGITGFVAGWVRIRKNIASNNIADVLTAYATLAVTCIIAMYAAGKLPLGIHRLNAFATPVLALLVVALLLRFLSKFDKIVKPVLLVLLLAASGNVFSSFISDWNNVESIKERSIYNNVTEAIHKAQQQDLPILVHRNICYPHDVHAEVTGAWVLPTYPAYDRQKKLPVFSVENREELQALMLQHHIATAMYIEQDSMMIISRN